MRRLRGTLLSFLAFFLLSPHAGKAQVAEQDSLALVALYEATDGPNWIDNTNWLGGPVATWFGVTVSGDRVTMLDMVSSNQLAGTIPGDIGALTALTFLRINNNSELTGEVPPALGLLTELTYLELAHNAFTGEIPAELGHLTRLSFLLLDGQFTGEIPPELGNLTALTSLRLTGQFTGDIPPEISVLLNLTALVLIGQLTGTISSELSNLTGLVALHLGGNQLTGAVPPELGTLTNLESLILYDNPLSGTLPRSLANLARLNQFWFHETNLCESTDPAFQAWLQSIDDVRSTGCTAVATEEPAALPHTFALEGNYPNPFNPETQIRYALPQAAPVRLGVYDARGRRVAVLISKMQPAGWHTARFEAGSLPGGVYFYRLEAGDFRASGRMVLLR